MSPGDYPSITHCLSSHLGESFAGKESLNHGQGTGGLIHGDHMAGIVDLKEGEIASRANQPGLPTLDTVLMNAVDQGNAESQGVYNADENGTWHKYLAR